MSVGIPISTNQNKRPRLATHKRDRFTSLHENMVSNILSRLPTKEVVRTRMLSKSWLNKWASIYNIDIDGEYDHDINNETFINFMNELFDSSKNLRSVRLLCRPRRSQPPPISARPKWISSFQNWISTSLRHNLEYFEVFHCCEEIFYPSTLLNKTSLEKLILGPSNSRPEILVLKPSHGTLYVSSVNCASNLTSVSLGPLTIVNENPLNTTVKFDFPTLETLAFNQCEWLNVKHLEIHAPSLTSFTSRVINIYNDDDYDYIIKVVSPRLTTFKCTSEKFILDGTSVVSASLTLKGVKDPKVCETIGSRARILLNKFSSLEELDLSWRIMAKVPQLRRQDKLTRLTLRTRDSCACEQLFELLHAMPILNFLRVNGAYMCFDYDDDDVPSCISSQLEEVMIRGFDETAREYDFVVFLLNTAKKLKKLTIGGSSSGLEDIENTLSSYTSCFPSLIVDIVNRDEIPY